MQAVVDEKIVTYVRSGSGRTVVMLHGWGDDSRTFAKISKHLAVNYEVIAVDLPGFGGTQGPAQAWGLNNYAEFVAAFLAKIGVDSVYAYVGHSNGGAIAIRGLSQSLLQAERLILLASAGVRTEDKTKKRALRLLAKTAKVAVKPLPGRVQNKLKKRAYAAVGSEMYVADGMQEIFKNIITDDVQDDAAVVTIPTLLIYGDADQATPSHWGQKFHQAITGSKFVLLDGGGHFIHHEQPERVATLVEEFLA